MQGILVPSNKRLVWYLAMEEYLVKNVQEELFFTWVVSPTVIFGRHQVLEAEVNRPYCEQHKIAMYRRKSGGGCVYADEGNLMMSLVSPDTHSEQVFQSFLDRVAGFLTKIGLPAVKSIHNDIMVDAHKVSGNACYSLPTGTIVHGTLLVDVNFERLQEAITPSVEKLSKHGVKSVRQRVRNISEILPSAQIDVIANELSASLCSKVRELTMAEMAAIDELEKTYLDPKFIESK